MDILRADKLTDEVGQTVEDMFEYHKWDTDQTNSGYYVRRALADAVKVMIDHVPPCPDRSAAIRKLREARMGLQQRYHAPGEVLR